MHVGGRLFTLILTSTRLLLKYCEAAVADRRSDMGQLRTKVENAIASVLPHGGGLMGEVARNLGMSERTLARKLSDEGLNFTEAAKARSGGSLPR
jgi:hypothetical protein